MDIPKNSTVLNQQLKISLMDNYMICLHELDIFNTIALTITT